MTVFTPDSTFNLLAQAVGGLGGPISFAHIDNDPNPTFPFTVPLSKGAAIIHADGRVEWDNEGDSTLHPSAGNTSTAGSVGYALTDGNDPLKSVDYVATVGLIGDVVVTQGPDIPTTMETSVTYLGVTFFFDRAVRVGYFVTGWPFVVSDQDFEITSITPASAVVDGYWANGAAKNPAEYVVQDDSNGDPLPDTGQPFDELMTVGQPANIGYRSSENIDPAATSANIVIALGEKATILKSVRAASATAATWTVVKPWVPLTILDAVPPVGTYRPSMSGTAKILRNRSDVVFTPRALPLPDLTLSAQECIDRTPRIQANFSKFGDTRRRFRHDSLDNPAISTNYSKDITTTYSAMILHLNSNTATAAQKQTIIDILMEHAGDLEGLIETGWYPGRDEPWWGQGAGQHGLMHPPLIAAAAMTRDMRFFTAANAIESNAWSNGDWITSAMVGQAAPPASGTEASTYFDSMVGMPDIRPDEFGPHFSARYKGIGGHICGWELAAMVLFNDGPAGFSDGLAMILNGGANDSTNQRAASLNFLARWVTFTPESGSSSPTKFGWIPTWQAIVAELGLSLWSGTPEQPPHGRPSSAFEDPYFTATDGGIRFDLPAGYLYTTTASTQMDLHRSIDGVQFVELLDVAANFDWTGAIVGVPHWMGWRNRAGGLISEWSENFPEDSANLSALKSVKTPTGSPSNAAAVFTHDPEIHYKRYPDWVHSTWLPAPATLSLAQEELAIGDGYYTGFPAANYTYEWLEDGVPVLTTKYARQADFTPLSSVQPRVTIDNGIGSPDVVTGAAKTIPVPVGTHIEQSPANLIEAGGSNLTSETIANVNLGSVGSGNTPVLLLSGRAQSAAAADGVDTVTIDGVACTAVATARVGDVFASIWTPNAALSGSSTAEVVISSAAGAFKAFAGDIISVAKGIAQIAPLDTATASGQGNVGEAQDVGLTSQVDGLILAATVLRTSAGGVQQAALAPEIGFEIRNPDIRTKSLAGMRHSSAATSSLTATPSGNGDWAAVSASWAA
jgi:hypothetical protein